DLEGHDRHEQRHFGPEQRRCEVEVGALLQPAERAQEAGREPEQGGDAPHAVGGEEPAEAGVVEQPLQRAPAEEDGRQAGGGGGGGGPRPGGGTHGRAPRAVPRAPPPAAWRSAKSRAGVTGTSRMVIPKSASASSIALAMTAAPGMAPLSPTPLIPSSLTTEGWGSWTTAIGGTWSAFGIA